MDRQARRLDEAARAAWLSYVAGKTQDEIAEIMGVSRQSAQRLVSQAMKAGLVKVRIDHPISRCLDLAQRLRDRFDLTECEIVPSLAGDAASSLAVSRAVGDRIEAWLLRPDPQTIGLGTGRTLRAAVEHMPKIDCARHRIVSLTGNIAADGSTAYYNVLFTITDKVTAHTFPMPLPVIAASVEERKTLLGQKTLSAASALSAQTDARFVGIGMMSANAPILLDGFIGQEDVDRLRAKGAVGEILGWVYDRNGEILDDDIVRRVCSVELDVGRARMTMGAAQGLSKLPAIRAAIRGRLIDSLTTDETTAEALLDA
nr:sugar-binding transcriptional regulator [Wenxinia marina]